MVDLKLVAIVNPAQVEENVKASTVLVRHRGQLPAEKQGLRGPEGATVVHVLQGHHSADRGRPIPGANRAATR